MYKYLPSFFVALFLFAVGTVWAAPTFELKRSLIPETDSTYYLGTTSPSVIAWLKLITDEICLTGDTCRTTWPTGGSGGGLASTSLSATSPITYDSGTARFGFDFSTNNTWTGNNLFSDFYVGTTSNNTSQDFFLNDTINSISDANFTLRGSSIYTYGGLGQRLTNLGGLSGSVAAFIIPKRQILEGNIGDVHDLITQFAVRAPVVTNADGTTNYAATVYIDGAPTGPSTNEYSLWVESGLSRLSEALVDGLTTTATLSAGGATSTTLSTTLFGINGDVFSDLTGSGLSVVGGALTANNNALATTSLSATSPLNYAATVFSINNDGITDTQLAFNTGQHLTTTSDVTFSEATTTNFFATNASTTNATSSQLYAGLVQFLNATTSNLSINNQLTFGGVSGTTWPAFCVSITGHASLCDGDDAAGSGGGADGNWTYNATDLFIRNSTTTNDIVMGATATATAPFFFDVSQSSLKLSSSTQGGTVGIGTSSPFANLSVHLGANENKTTIFAIGSSTASATTTLFSVGNTGLVTYLNSSGAQSTTTSLFASVASTTALYVTGLATCDATTGKLTYSNGTFGCGTDFNTGGAGGLSTWDINSLGQLAPTTTRVVTVNSLVATGTATSTFVGGVQAVGAYLTSFFTLGSDTISDITGSGLVNVNGALTVNNNALASTSLSATSPIFYSSATGVISSQAVSGSQDGYLTSTQFGVLGNQLATTSINTSAKLSSILSDETGTGFSVFSFGASMATTTMASTTLTASTTMQNATSSTFATTLFTLGSDVLSDITGTALSLTAGALGVTADSITDTQLAFNTGQHLTTTSDVTFAEATTTNLFSTNASTTNATSSLLYAGLAQFLNATTSNLAISNQLTFNGVSGTTWPAFCVAITGHADLCDGSDATGGGGGTPDWEKQTNFGALALTPTTTIPIWAKAAIYASSTLNIKNNRISQHNAGFLDVQRDGSDFTLMRIRAPYGDSNEATLSLVNDLSATDAGVDEEFVDFYNERYADSLQWGMRQAYSGTGIAKPFIVGHWATAGSKDAGNKLIVLPSGTVAVARATSTIPQTVPFYVASSTAGTLARFDAAPGSPKFAIGSAGDITMTGTNGNLNMNANTDGGQYNLNVDTSGTLAIFGGSSTFLNVSLLDGTFTVASNTSLQAATTTSLFSTIASTTKLFVTGLATCDATTGKLTYSGGTFGCGTDFNTGGSGGLPDWNKQTTFGTLSLTPTTTIPIWAKSTIYASSTMQFNTNLISEHASLHFLDVQGQAERDYTLMRLKAPTFTGHSGKEATFSLLIDVDGNNAGVNEEFVDFYNERYDDSHQWGMRQFYGGTGVAKPFVLGHWGASGKDAGNKLIILPSGAVAVARATSTVPAIPFYVASSTATTLARFDTTPGSPKFAIGSAGDITMTGTSGNLNLNANVDGGQYNVAVDTTGTLAFFGSSAQTLNVTVLDGTFTASNNTSLKDATSTTLFSTIASSTNLFSASALFKNATSSTLAATLFGINSDVFSDLTGSGLSVVSGALTVNNNALATTSLSATSPLNYAATVFSINNDGIGDTQLAFNTGQHLTTTSDVTFSEATTTSSFATVASSTNLFANVVNFANGALTNVINAFTALGTWDFGGATSFEIVNGAASVVDAIGEMAFDTTDNQLIVATSTNATYPAVFPMTQRILAVTVASTSADFESGGRLWIPIQRDGYEIREIHCAVDGGTNKTINISNSGGTTDTDSVVCDADGQSDLSMSQNATVAAGALMSIEFGATTGAVDYVTISVFGNFTRE
jgi:hypothetical protein